MPDGRFTRLEAPSPPKIREEALEEGEPLSEVVRERRVPHHPVGSPTPKEASPGQRLGPDESGDHPQTPVYADALPWGPAGPVNDANRAPMKLK